MNIAKERTQIDVGGRDKTLAALSSQAECFEMDETDDGRTDRQRRRRRRSKFFPGDKSLSLSLSLSLPLSRALFLSLFLPPFLSLSHPLFQPFPRSPSPLQLDHVFLSRSRIPLLLPSSFLAFCSQSVRDIFAVSAKRGSKRWVGRRGGGGKVGETKTTTPRERENQRSDRHPTPFPTATRKGLLRSGGLDLDPPLHKWLGGVFALKLGIKTVPNRK